MSDWTTEEAESQCPATIDKYDDCIIVSEKYVTTEVRRVTNDEILVIVSYFEESGREEVVITYTLGSTEATVHTNE